MKTYKRCPVCDSRPHNCLCRQELNAKGSGESNVGEWTVEKLNDGRWCLYMGDRDTFQCFDAEELARTIAGEHNDTLSQPNPTPTGGEALVGECNRDALEIEAWSTASRSEPTMTEVQNWAITIRRAAAEIESMREQNTVMRQCWEKAERERNELKREVLTLVHVSDRLRTLAGGGDG